MESSIQQCSGPTCTSIKNAATSGVIAAVTAPFLMALGFLIWDVTWKKAGGSAFALNLFKCNLASIAFLIMCFIDGFVKDDFKVDNGVDVYQYEEYYNAESIGFLVLSSTLGILIGDTLWLVALTEIGAARVLVVDAIKPFVAAILGRVLLGETLQPVAFTGIFLTVVGILIVSLDKEGKDVNDDNDNNDDNDDEEVCRRTTTDTTIEDAIEMKQSSSLKQKYVTLLRSVPSGKKYGYLCAVTNVIFDAYGSLLTKQHGVGMTTWGINLIRFGFAGVTMTIMSSIMRMQHFLIQNRNQQNEQEHTSQEITNINENNNWYKLPSMKYKPWIKVSIGVMLVTFLCPSLSNYALFQIALALAITLGSVTPLYALLLEWPIKGNKPTFKSFIGSVFAIAGVVILSIWK